VVTAVEAPARHSAEACSAGHVSKPTSGKSAARGHAAVEGSPAAVQTTATAAVSAATTATRGGVHRHRRNADCRNSRKSDHHFPEHGTLLFKGVAPDNQKPRPSLRIPDVTQIHFGMLVIAATCCVVGHTWRDTSRHLVAGLYRFDRGFGFAASSENCIACKRDVRRVGLRHPVDNGACLRQRIEDNVKAGFCLRDLAKAGIVQNHQEADADQTSFHGRFPINGHNPKPGIQFRPQPRIPCPGGTSPDFAAGSCINAYIIALTKKLSMLSF
jgi:hypothetical protein